MHGVSIVMPAFRAEDTIAQSVSSVLQQHYQHWELLLVADDATDYEVVLGRSGLRHPGIRFLATGGTGSGAAVARNVGLDAARFEYVATLDADDLMHPQKLELAVAQLQRYSIVSCAFQLLNKEYKPLRTVGLGADRVLTCRNYKFVNFSGDSMLVYDRQVADPRFDPTLFCANDLDFLLKLFAKTERSFHLGRALHSYVKQSVSLTKGPGTSEKIARTKHLLMERLSSGYYPFTDPEGVDYVKRFLSLSLMAEAAYGQAVRSNPDALFEDYIEQEIRSESDDFLKAIDDVAFSGMPDD